MIFWYFKLVLFMILFIFSFIGMAALFAFPYFKLCDKFGRESIIPFLIVIPYFILLLLGYTLFLFACVGWWFY